MSTPTPIAPTSNSPWRQGVLIAAVAVGTFSFGHFWGRESSRHEEGMRGQTVADSQDTKLSVGKTSTISATSPDKPHGKPLWTCSMHPQVIQDAPGICPICHMELTPLKASASGDSSVTIDPIIVQNMGVRTAMVVKGPLIQSVRVVGYLEEPEPLHRDINLRVSGWVEKLYANTDGMVIEKGKPLFDLYSPELTIAIDEMISARKQLTLTPDDAISKSLLDTARRKLEQYGLESEQVDGLEKLDAAPRTIPILAPMSGHLTAKMVYEGAAAKAGDLILRLASRHEMWIDAQVYEQQMSLISDGQPVRATLVAEPGKTFEGKVLFVHPHVDPVTRTALARIEISNHDMRLRQGMYASVEILADNYKDAIVIPREAVIDTGRKQIAFVALGGGKFEPRQLKLGAAGQDGTVQVLSGVTAGEQIVTSGQFLLDSESRLQEAIAKFSAPAGVLVTGSSIANTPVAQSTLPSTSQPSLAISIPHTDDIVKAYLTLAKSLGQRQESPTPLDPSALEQVALMAVEHTSDADKSLPSAIATAAASLRGKTLDDQREAFVVVSDAVLALVRHSRPSTDVAPLLYVIRCPMAFSAKGVEWIQDNDTVANPYYATEMKRCGSVIEHLQSLPRH